jgi:type II secretory pathway component PulK
LPLANSKINICTAPALVLESLADDLSGEYSRTPEVLVSGRKTGCFPEAAAFNNVLGRSAAAAGPWIATSSSYFRLTTHVTLGTTEFTLYSLLNRTAGGKVSPLLRTFGTL